MQSGVARDAASHGIVKAKGRFQLRRGGAGVQLMPCLFRILASFPVLLGLSDWTFCCCEGLGVKYSADQR